MLIFIDNFQFLSSSSDIVVKNLSKDDFNYLSKEFHINVLELAKQKGFYPMSIGVILKSLRRIAK